MRPEFQAGAAMQQMLGSAGQLRLPEDLGLRLRLAISHESARRAGPLVGWHHDALGELVAPALLQASAGLAGAVVLVGSLAMLIGVVAAPQAGDGERRAARRVDRAALSFTRPRTSGR